MLLNGLPEICIKRAGTELFINIFSFWLVAAKSADSVLTGSKTLWFNRQLDLRQGLYAGAYYSGAHDNNGSA
jgi:hypothetical protein